MYRAFNDPKELKKLDPSKQFSTGDILERIEAGELSPMLKIPKKKSKASNNG